MLLNSEFSALVLLFYIVILILHIINALLFSVTFYSYTTTHLDFMLAFCLEISFHLQL